MMCWRMVGEGRSPPPSYPPEFVDDGLRACNEDTVLESLLLSVAHYWSLRETKEKLVELLETFQAR